MLDNITLTINWPHEQFGDKRTRENQNTGKKVGTREAIVIHGARKGATLEVRSLNDGTGIRVSGSFPMYLQGHNAFGANNMLRLCEQTVRHVFKKLKIEIRPQLRNAIKNAKLSRVDVTGGFRLPSVQVMPEAIQGIGEAMATSVAGARFISKGTVHIENIHRQTTVLFYDKKGKWDQAPLAQLALSSDERRRVSKYVEGLLRFEVRLWDHKLAALELTKVSAWTATTVHELLTKRLAEFAFDAGLELSNYEDVSDKLSSSALRNFKLYSENSSVFKDFSRSSLARLRAECRAIGINIDQPPPNRTRVLLLRDLLRPDRMRYRFPGWAKQLGRVAGLENFEGLRV